MQAFWGGVIYEAVNITLSMNFGFLRKQQTAAEVAMGARKTEMGFAGNRLDAVQGFWAGRLWLRAKQVASNRSTVMGALTGWERALWIPVKKQSSVWEMGANRWETPVLSSCKMCTTHSSLVSLTNNHFNN